MTHLNVVSRQPRAIHAALLLITVSLTVMVAAILGPSLPNMQKYYAGVPGVDYLVPLTVTAPMLAMTIVSVLVGYVADRVGRKRLLVVGTVLYAVVGMAPLWLESLYAVIASRLAIGIAEAVIITCSTIMIGDYYHGARREKFISLQTTVSAGSAVVLSLLGGIIGEYGWRAPYLLYGVGLLLAPLMQGYLWEPRSHGAVHENLIDLPGEKPVTFRPWLLVGICAITVFTGLAFLSVPVHLGYLYGAIGVSSSASIGVAAALNCAGVMIGTLIFAWWAAKRLRVAHQLALSVAVAGLGFALMGVAQSYVMLTLALIINGLGCGLIMPTVNTWNMRELPSSHRGVGTGAFMSSLFLGYFINPLVVVYAGNHTGGRAQALALGGWIMLAAALLVVAVSWGVWGINRNTAIQTGDGR